MVRHDDCVFRLYKGHEITEPLVIHKLRDSIPFYTAKPVLSQFHRLISSCSSRRLSWLTMSLFSALNLSLLSTAAITAVYCCGEYSGRWDSMCFLFLFDLKTNYTWSCAWRDLCCTLLTVFTLAVSVSPCRSDLSVASPATERPVRNLRTATYFTEKYKSGFRIGWPLAMLISALVMVSQFETIGRFTDDRRQQQMPISADTDSLPMYWCITSIYLNRSGLGCLPRNSPEWNLCGWQFPIHLILDP